MENNIISEKQARKIYQKYKAYTDLSENEYIEYIKKQGYISYVLLKEHILTSATKRESIDNIAKLLDYRE